MIHPMAPGVTQRICPPTAVTELANAMGDVLSPLQVEELEIRHGCKGSLADVIANVDKHDLEYVFSALQRSIWTEKVSKVSLKNGASCSQDAVQRPLSTPATSFGKRGSLCSLLQQSHTLGSPTSSCAGSNRSSEGTSTGGSRASSASWVSEESCGRVSSRGCSHNAASAQAGPPRYSSYKKIPTWEEMAARATARMNSMSERQPSWTPNDAQSSQPTHGRGSPPSRAASIEAVAASSHRAPPRDSTPPARAMLSTFERVKAAQQRRQAEGCNSHQPSPISASANRRSCNASPQGITGSSNGSVPRQPLRQRKSAQQGSAVGPGALDVRRVESWHARAERARERAAWVQQRADELLEQHFSLAGSRSMTARPTLSSVASQPILQTARESLPRQKQQQKQQQQQQQPQPQQRREQWHACEPRAELRT